MSFLFYNIPCIICLAIAGFGMYHDKEGWGWFLFLAFLAGVIPASKDKTDD
jgi:hypothetical protein